ncbi:Gfo/Idh/MocA family protein [Shimia abyssi]|uniref:Putative dehydrogenase n=1 Tax=Shimia abyssi TaxID=1662395 RepID=A0A2P8FI23_9RHOB|nr:Gfo/Idh/MocA family oxidoreductase [Shimia abyssi]PSL21373.1 putative dehydrogenase [Shimia abyssi]
MANITRIAVVGFGLIGKRHAQSLQQTAGVAIAGIVEPDKSNGAAARAMGVPVFATLEELFDKCGPDGVILATPTPLHVEQGLTCIAHGCPVLIEKPIAVSADEARSLTDAAEAATVPLLVGHHRRHNGMVRAAKQAIMDGAIGDIRSVQATCWFYKPDYYFEAAPWRTRKGAGPISVNLVHDIDLLRHFCGEVKHVQAVAAPSRRGFENEDLATAILTFESGLIASISVSDSIVSPWSWELTARENPAYPATNQSCYMLGGSEGAMSLPDLRVWKHQNTQDWWTPIGATSLLAESGDPLMVQVSHFADVIRGEALPLVSGLEGLKSLEVVEAVTRAAASGATVTLCNMSAGTTPPVKEEHLKNI